ncbi:unnamed protein product [Cylindrotheca closterium]|uniref:Protochlorophyllide reductase n=1 Tax=Cylindrotheca closterium TaxID=2856 RepID=A0AAD2CLS6_9STRA|nr:unnamed protein product [Cylindrotheca closterium]
MHLSLLGLFVAYISNCYQPTAALSLQGPPKSDRKGFLHQGALILGGSVPLGGLLSVPEAAIAAPKLYEPPANSQVGKVHIITGASTGLGLESAKRIAAAGATVVLTSRTPTKGEAAVQQVQDYLSQKNVANSNIYFLTLDLDDLSTVQSFPERFSQLLPNTKVDVLMNNAGIEINKREITRDGFERTFQSNHLGPFVLTALLFPLLNRDGSRVVNLSSTAHSFAGVLDLQDLNFEKNYVGWLAYCRTKLENILFTQELQRRADAAGFNWFTTTCLHPGVVGTDIWRDNVAKGSDITSKLFYGSMKTVAEGANSQIYQATEKPTLLKKGRYYDEFCNVKQLESFAMDPASARALWEESEKLSGVAFKLR